MNTQTTFATIGRPVFHSGKVGYIANVLPAPSGVFMIGGGGMSAVENDLEIVFDDHISTLSDSVVKTWADRADQMALKPIAPEQLQTMREQALAAQEARKRDAVAAREREAAERRAFLEIASDKMPIGAKAVIIAELIEDQSDSMTDYFGSKTVQTVILGFSRHTRDLFPELRKAALNFAQTADLFDAPASAEHREKYSMGGGFYLKTAWRYSNGWRISKKTLYSGLQDIPTGEWALTAPAAQTAAPVAAIAANIERHTHDKKGFEMFIVTMGDRVEREEYNRLLALAKESRGWWSRKWGRTPSGFAFKSEEAAIAFAAHLGGETVAEVGAQTQPIAEPNSGTADKLRALADGLQGEIDSKLGERLANTPKRQRDAQNARIDGYRLQRTQTALRALADRHEAGTVPAELRGVTTKKAVFDLARSEVTYSGGYYDGGRDTDKPALSTPAALALWSLLEPKSAAQRAADDLRGKIQALQFANIPGYFPTPAAIVSDMIEAARLPARCSILEPEAGSGAILDAVCDLPNECELVIFERHGGLCEILKLKGYTIAGRDFMESEPFKVDRVLMNPPFENGQDIAHVRRAFDHLAPGGRLVAIMSPGPFYRQDAKATAFRQWFEDLGGERIDIAAGAFKESGTGVASVMVIIDAD